MLHSRNFDIQIPSFVRDVQDLDFNTRLLLSSSRGLVDVLSDVLKCVSKDLDLNSTDTRGMTALHLAAYSGFTQIVKMLVNDDRLEINKLDKMGRHAILLAWERSNAEVVDIISRAISLRHNIERNDDSLEFIKHMISTGSSDPLGEIQDLDYIDALDVEIDLKDVANMDLSMRNMKYS